MQRKLVLVSIIMILTSGCAGKGFNRGEMVKVEEGTRPTYLSKSISIEEIEKLKPQIHLPFKLAVAQPQMSYGWRWDANNYWSSEEISEIESWAAPLQKAGVVSELFILPSNLPEICPKKDAKCTKADYARASAARVQADTLLMINLATAVDEYANPASLLNLTIVGMWLAPGHHRDALTIAEGVLIDNRNEYLYAYARGEAEEGTIRPYMFADSRNAVRTSRLHAIQALGQEFIKQANKLKTK